ncbi:hypothetical protein [Chlamydia vaughanii]|uniref:hypothetical protein n=1 Tax=Chlamydia vaughanii TaxID=3112552 RepID=UPI0032B10EAC
MALCTCEIDYEGIQELTLLKKEMIYIAKFGEFLKTTALISSFSVLKSIQVGTC